MNKRVFALALIVALGSQAAWASPISRRVDTARSRRATGLQTLRGLEGQLGGVRGELTTAVSLLDAATVRLVDARTTERDAAIRLALAQDVLVRRVRAAYEQGPDNALDMFFSAKSPGDLLSINEYTAHAVLSDLNAVDQVRRGKLEIAREQQALRMRQSAMQGQPASHGCIRLPWGFAQRLYAVTTVGTPVTIRA